MPRIRTIKPEFFTDEDIADLSPITRLVFIGLWTLADKAGRLKDNPRTIKARILPFEGKIDMNSCLNDLAQAGFIVRYSVEDVPYIQVRTWDQHQRTHHTEPPSSIPRCDNGCATVVDACLREGKGRERKGKERKGKEGAPSAPTANERVWSLPEVINTPEVQDAINRWIIYKSERGESYRPQGETALINKLAQLSTPERVVAAIDHSMGSNYAGIYERRTPATADKSKLTTADILADFMKLHEHDEDPPCSHQPSSTSGTKISPPATPPSPSMPSEPNYPVF